MGITDMAMGKASGKGGMAAMGSSVASTTLAPQIEGILSKTGIAGVLDTLGVGRIDPVGAFHYFLEIEGIQIVRFRSVGGMKMTTQVDYVREGGNNRFKQALIGGQTFEPLTVKKGFYAMEGNFFNWMKEVHDPSKQLTRKSLSLVVLSDASAEVCRFNFYGAFISSYEGPTFDSQSKEIAFESMKLHYDFFEFAPGDVLTNGAFGALGSGTAMLGNAL